MINWYRQVRIKISTFIGSQFIIKKKIQQPPAAISIFSTVLNDTKRTRK